MIIKQYSTEYKECALANNNIDFEKRFSSEERSHLYTNIQKEYQDNKDSFISHYVSHNSGKLESLTFIKDIISQYKFSNIISLGAGECVLEFLLYNLLQKKVSITATDFNKTSLKLANRHFPEIKTDYFDFFEDSFIEKFRNKFDCVLFFGSSYILNNDEMKKLISQLKLSGIKYVIDCHVSILSTPHILFRKCTPDFLLNNSLIRKFLNKPQHLNKKKKFHGYNRNKKELQKIYKNEKIKIKSTFSVKNYPYSTFLELPN